MRNIAYLVYITTDIARTFVSSPSTKLKINSLSKIYFHFFYAQVLEDNDALE